MMFTLSRPRRSAVFLYGPAFAASGSTIMRGKQLAELAAKQLPDFEVSYRPLGFEPKGAAVFLTKGALKEASREQLLTLKARGNRLFFDLVDEAPPSTVDLADAVVAASLTAFQDLSAQLPSSQVVLVNHHVDPRISVQSAPHDKLRIGYFGELVNTAESPRLRDAVAFVQVDTSRETTAWLGELGRYNMHFAVRRTRALDFHKPFLKGFTAAACFSNIVIQRSQREALAWLGEDYPYLVNAEASEDQVLEVIDFARESFGQAPWQDGLGRMAEIRARISPARIGAELRRALS